MTLYVWPSLFALFVWWFSTGAIMYLDGLPRRTFIYSMMGATASLAVALFYVGQSAHDTTLHGAYVGFAAGVFAWGWQEISFYMGFVTGPRKAVCPEGCSGWAHFIHAIETSLWHELAIIASAIVVVALSWHQPNKVAMWTFMVLWWMHQSAKLNVFLGVRNLNEEFLPEHLAFLKGFLTKKPMNLLFPVSITLSMVICTIMWQRATATGASAFDRSAYTFIGTMMALAIIEHWFLVLPLPAQKLWSWSLASRKPEKPFDVAIVAGFLGAGKTTYMKRLLAAPTAVKTIVLVNDFAAVGVDGALLEGQGADVVELPNGCICCSLKTDLAVQLKDVVARFAPERVLIEPSGVADLASLLRVLNGPDLAMLVRGMEVTTIVDAGSFLNDFGRMGGHLTAQIIPAGNVIVSKADLVTPALLRAVFTTIRAIAPDARIAPARYGLIDLSAVPAPVLAGLPADNVIKLHDHAAAACDLDQCADPSHGHNHRHDHEHSYNHDHAHAHGDAAQPHSHDVLGLTSWSAMLAGACDTESLEILLDAVVGGNFGQVERLKGVAQTGSGWVKFDVAGGRASIAAVAAPKDGASRVVAIGRDVDEEKLLAAFVGCELREEAA